jgi:hypothetical protein
MSIVQLLEEMAANLSEVDVNAIRKARGFSARETASRSTFASFFASSIGLEEVMQGLTAEENATLRLLHQNGEADIAFFERLYGSAAQPGKDYYGTITQRYRSTFDAVRRGLVRRGVLIMAETKIRAAEQTVQMARWRFALPPEFAAYLPPLLRTQASDQPGEMSDWAIRKKLLQLVGGGPAIPNDQTPITLQEGSLYLGQQPFSVDALRKWQMDAWIDAFNPAAPYTETSLLPTDAVRSLLADLAPGEWASADSLTPALKIYSYGAKLPTTDRLLRTGWELGLLSRLEMGPSLYYRLAPASEPAGLEQAPAGSPAWLRCAPQSGIVGKPPACAVELRSIPLDQLALLNALADLRAEGDAVYVIPGLARLGRADPAERASALAGWLAQALPDFRDALAVVDARWGKTILHENLLVARVQDLSLRIQIERELGAEVVVLDEHFIAFPTRARARVEKVLKKTGFVVKTVTP